MVAPYLETFDIVSNIGEFNQSTTDDIDWTQNSGSTQSNNTGPSDDITGGGYYMYVEASNPNNPNKSASLYSNCINITTLSNPCLLFNYHMYGQDMGTLEIFIDGISAWSISGDQGDQWYIGQVTLDSVVNPSNVVIDFVGTTGTGYASDIAIDQVSVDECAVLGCTDPNACNYDSIANIDDGSCLTAFGCTNPTACNYNFAATCDDGSCILPDGCTDSLACNYDSTAICDDGSCLITYGCTDSLACNYDPSATCDDGSCLTGTSYSVINDTTICNGFSYTVGSNVYTTSGTYIDTYLNLAGCDSIITTNLTITSANYTSIHGGIPDNNVGGGGYYSGSQYLELSCYESSKLISAVVYSQDTTLSTFEIRDDNGNVLSDTTYLVIPGGHRIYFNYEMTAGTDYQLGVNGGSNDLYRNNSGVNYPYDFASVAAITSSSAGSNYYYFYYDLEIMPYATYNDIAICDGSSYTVGSNTYTTSGIYHDVLTASNNCDSTVITTLVVNVATTSTSTEISCDSYTWNGTTYTASGPYTYTTTNSNGCDSIAVLYLTINNSNTGSSSVTTCDSYTWSGQSITTSGSYNQTFINVAGCDSVHTLVATINYSPTIQITQNVLDLEAIVSGGASPYAFQWNTNAITQSITPLTNGTYWCIVTDINGCISDTVFINVNNIPSSLYDMHIHNLTIFPNPSRDIFNITFTTNKKQNLKVRLVNLIGEQLITEDLEQFIGKYTKQIDLTGNAKGIYFLEIETNNGVINKKLILQ